MTLTKCTVSSSIFSDECLPAENVTLKSMEEKCKLLVEEKSKVDEENIKMKTELTHLQQQCKELKEEVSKHVEEIENKKLGLIIIWRKCISVHLYVNA